MFARKSATIAGVGVIAGLLFILVRSVEAAPSPYPAVEADLLNRVNAVRVARGAPAFVPDPLLGEIAARRSADMAGRDYFSHTVPGCAAEIQLWTPGLERSPCSFLTMLNSQRFPYVRAGEVLEWNRFLTQFPQERANALAIADFLRSPAHERVLLDPRFGRAGVGVAITADRKMILTVVFTQG